MRLFSGFVAIVLSVFVSGCSGVTEDDLRELQSPNTIVKQEAIKRISKGRQFPVSLMDSLVSSANTKRAADIMVELLRSEKESKGVELTLVEALGALGRRIEFDASPLIQRLKDKDPRLRGCVIEALGKTKTRKAVPALVELLAEEKDRYPVVWALGEIGDPRAVAPINRLLASEDKYLRFNAYRALTKIGSVEVNGSSNSENTEKQGLVDLGKSAFKKYQDVMLVVFRKIAGLKNA